MTPLDILCFGLVYVVWGSTYFAIREMVAGIPPFLGAGTRFVIAAALMTLLFGRKFKKASRIDWIRSSLQGVLMLAIGNGLVSLAEKEVSSGHAALVAATVPIWVAVFNRWFDGPSALSPRKSIGLVLGFSGVVVLVLGEITQRSSILHAVFLLIATLSWTVGSFYQRRRPTRMPSVQAAMVQMLAGGLTLLAFSFSIGEAGDFPFSQAPRNSLIALAYLSVAGSVIAYSAYVYLLQRFSTDRVSTYAFVNPIVAVVLGGLAGETHWSATLGVSTLCVCVGVALILAPTRPRQKHNHTPKR